MSNRPLETPACTNNDHDRVTLKPKCYVFVCAGCDLLDVSERSDKLTCSPACRVRAHRSGRFNVIRETAKSQEIPPALILQSIAIERLRPDLAHEIHIGRLNNDDVRADVYRAFIERVFADVAASDGSGQ
jgi:hypothetical protein